MSAEGAHHQQPPTLSIPGTPSETHVPACARCETALDNRHVKAPADDGVYQVGYIFETLETVDAVVKAIFRRVTWEVHPQKPTPQPAHRYVDTHSNSSSPSLNTLRNPRPCVVMQRALKNEAGSLLVICLMATFWGTVDVALLPSVLRFFVVAVWPHIAVSEGRIHFHTTPDWPANRNTWLIAYRHNTTSYRTIARWSYHKDTRYSYIYDTHTCAEMKRECEVRENRWLVFATQNPARVSDYWHEYQKWASQGKEQPPRKAAHSPRTPSSHSKASSISLTPGLVNTSTPQENSSGSQPDVHSTMDASSAIHSSWANMHPLQSSPKGHAGALYGHSSSDIGSGGSSLHTSASSSVNHMPPAPCSPYSNVWGSQSHRSRSPGSSNSASTSPVSDEDFPPLSPHGSGSRMSHSPFQPSPLRSTFPSQSSLPQLRPLSQAESQDGDNGALQETVRDLRELTTSAQPPLPAPSPADLGVKPAVSRRGPQPPARGSFAEALSRAASTVFSARTSRSNIAQSNSTRSHSRTALSSSANASGTEQDGQRGPSASEPSLAEDARGTGRGRGLRGAARRMRDRVKRIVPGSS